MKIFEKIRTMREIRKWSQEYMAEQLNISTNGYSKIERGETQLTIARLQQIANILDIDPAELIQEHDSGLVLQIGDNNTNGMNTITLYGNHQSSLTFEIEKQKLVIQHQAALLEQKENELSVLKELLATLKAQNGHSA